MLFPARAARYSGVMQSDWYEVLGVPPGAAASEIRSAYRALAFLRHPDRNGGDQRAAASFMRLQAAYEVLSDPHRRALYDRVLAARAREAVPRRAPPSPLDAELPAKTVPARGSALRLLLVFGLFLELKGFAGAFVVPRLAFLPGWLLPDASRDESVAIYLIGTAVVFYAVIARLLRRD